MRAALTGALVGLFVLCPGIYAMSGVIGWGPAWFMMNIWVWLFAWDIFGVQI